MVLMVSQVQSDPEAQLVQLRQTRHARRLGPGRRQSRQDQGCQHCNDGYHDQQFDQGEAILAVPANHRFYGLGISQRFLTAFDRKVLKAIPYP
jgi:hypothetical protein